MFFIGSLLLSMDKSILLNGVIASRLIHASTFEPPSEDIMIPTGTSKTSCRYRAKKCFGNDVVCTLSRLAVKAAHWHFHIRLSGTKPDFTY